MCHRVPAEFTFDQASVLAFDYVNPNNSVGQWLPYFHFIEKTVKREFKVNGRARLQPCMCHSCLSSLGSLDVVAIGINCFSGCHGKNN